MTKDKIQKIIFDALEMVNQSRDENAKIPVSAQTALFGNDGYLDSMGLVSLLIDIEESLQGEGVLLSLSDERAMSEKNSPFRDVPSLTEYILRLVGTGEENDAA